MEMLDILSQPGWSTWLMLAIILSILYIFRQPTVSAEQACSKSFKRKNPPLSKVSAALVKRLPKSVFLQDHPSFDASLNSYWSKQNREIVPECIVRPRNKHEVSAAVAILKDEFDHSLQQQTTLPTFAIRGGGHSTIAGASNTSGGITIDLSLLNEVTLADDRASVLVGAGARWGDVSWQLDPVGLAVVGGRNSDVGVAGLTLGGGYSYFSPQYGFACDNVLEYTIVLASGAIETVSENQNHGLWRALKGGVNNFGIVTSFRLRTIPCTNVWSGFLFMFSWKAPEVIRAFYDAIEGPFDESAGGPLLCISFVQRIGISIISTHLMYTKATPWPRCWQGFKKIGRVWSSTKIRTITSTTDELDNISPAGLRQIHVSTTVQNELSTLEEAHAVFKRQIRLLEKIKGLGWTLVLQPLHTSTMRHGEYNIFGLRGRPKNLVVVLFKAVWARAADDDLVNGTSRRAIDQINDYATAKGTADRFRYLNWCDNTQHPFQSYGEENLQFLRDTCKHFDPDGLFQRACVGGYKLMSE